MADQIVFSEQPTGKDAPAADENTNSNENTNTNQENNQEGNSDRPDWLPENFKTVEDYNKSFEDTRAALTKAQQELADLRKASEQNADKGEGEGEGGDDDEGGDKKDDKSDKRPSNREVTEEQMMDYSKELAENGELSEESRNKIIEQFDVPDWLLDTYIEGVKAIQQSMTGTIDNAFGGAEQRDAMLAWAGENMSEQEAATLETQLNSTDINTVLFAADALKTKYEAANGKAPATRLGGKTPVGNTGAYQSWEQVTADMAKPEYKTDPAFRAQVQKKLAAFNG